jgi:serine protease inhibitor
MGEYLWCCAATAVVMDIGVIPEEPVELAVDRSFAFLICDIEIGAILFVGRVMNPSE